MEKNKIHETYDILKIDLAKVKVNMITQYNMTTNLLKKFVQT